MRPEGTSGVAGPRQGGRLKTGRPTTWKLWPKANARLDAGAAPAPAIGKCIQLLGEPLAESTAYEPE